MPNKYLNLAQRKKGCQARLVMGDHLAKTWAQCPIRLKGTCCKDCSQIDTCDHPCSFLYPYYNMGNKTYNFTNFHCRHFLTPIEGVIKRLDTDAERGVKE